MSAIVPAILPTSWEDLESKLARLEGIADDVQIDITDGVFANPASWPYTGGTHLLAEMAARGESLPFVGKMRFEIDLMVADPEAVSGIWLSFGAVRLTIHAESTSYLPKLITDLQVKYGHDKDFAPGLVSIGLALNVESELGLIDPFLNTVDYVQFMGIKTIGRQGEPFDTRVLRKIAVFRRQHPDIRIQVDGGVSKETAPALLSAGVDRLIVGSDIWRASDLKEEYRQLSELVPRYGLYS